MRIVKWVLIGIELLVLVSVAVAAPPSPDADFPRVPFTPAAEAPKTFRVHSGLRLELVASEPLIESPVGISFDEDGRLFVVEMRDYPDRQQDAMGRIKLLESSKQDGHYDKVTVFAEHLAWPTSVFCYGGGVYVTASPDIIWLKDTRAAGRADERRAILTGFGAGVDPLNVQALLNNLTWNLDDRIEGTPSFNGGLVISPGSSRQPLNLHLRDFSFDPRTGALSAENGGGQHGMTFDQWGRKYVCMNAKPVETFMYDARYAGRNPLYAMPPSLVEVNADGQDVYRISPEEAWRVHRTKLRVSGQVKGVIEGGGRASGYFTGVSGVTVYTGDALPPEFRGNAFAGEVANNLVTRHVLTPDGVGVVARRAPEEQKTEFLASTDIWFRPVQFANAPDGALYIIDMYRECIEHPWSLPEDMKTHLDLHSGVERGRIWRVVPEGFVPRKMPKLSTASTAELVALLEHPNGWHRDTAARLLFQRHDPAAGPLLAKLLKESLSAVGRLRALCALGGQGLLDESHVTDALADPDPHVRARAVLMSERRLRDGQPHANLWARLRQLSDDPDINVRYQLAFTLGETREPGRVEALAAIATRDAGDRWMQAAVLSSSADIEAALFDRVAKSHVGGSEGGQQFLQQLARMIGQRHRDADVTRVLGAVAGLSQDKDPRLAFSLARALRDGQRRGRAAGAAGQEKIETLLARARTVVADPAAAEPTRIEAARLLGTTSFEQSGATLLSLLDNGQPQQVQVAAIEALDAFAAPQVAPALIERFAAFPPQVRAAALASLLRRPERATAMLHAIEAGKMRSSDVTSAQANALRSHRDAGVRELANKVLAAATSREPIVRQFQPALALDGDAARGHAIYQQRCVQCHKLGGEGSAVGPDLTTIRNDGKAKALVNILDPNREVAPNFVAYVCETREGESVVGLITGETPTSVTIRQPFGKESVVLRSDVRRLVSQKLSLMPEGLEDGLKPQDLADLLEFVFTAPASR